MKFAPNKKVMKTALNKLIFEEAGQAAVEYILLLVVVVGILLGSVYQFNSAFSVWADNYFGDYLACLIESGELPTLGGSAGTSSECDQLFKPFNIANGRGPLVGSTSSEGAADSSDKRGDEGDDDSSSSYSGGSGAVIVGGGRDSAFSRFGAPRRFRATKRVALGDENSSQSDGVNTGSASITDISGYESGKAIRIPLRDSEQIKKGRRIKEEDKEKKLNTKVASKREQSPALGVPTRVKIERRLASNTAAPEIEEFTFGRLFRYLLMIAIILAVIIFIGGQAIQVSKSMD